MHFYQFNIGDYKSHTEHLSELEDLAYRRMLDWYYLHEKQLPLDVEEIGRLIRMRSHCECIATVLQEFFVQTESGWSNPRADEELAKIGQKKQKATASAKARWGKRDVDANAMRTQCERNATQDTIHKTQDTIQKKEKAQRTSAPTCPHDVSEQVWNDYLAVRKAKRSPLTETALKTIEKEASKAGWSVEKALSECAARGWIGFKAEWVDKAKTQNLSFAERDELLRRKKYEEMTGRPWPEDDALPLQTTATWELLK